MSIFKNSIPDPRVREFLPAERILYSSGAENAGNWIGNRNCIAHIPALPQSVIAPGGCVILDFGIELFGGVRVISNQYGMIKLTFGESVSETMLVPDQTHNIRHTELEIPANGISEYGTTAFRFVRIENISSDNIYIVNILAVALVRELPRRGLFECSDPRLCRIWDTARHTITLVSQEYIFDGAKRDRIVWAGDLHPVMRSSIAAFGDTGLIEQTLDFLIANTAPDAPVNGIYSYNCHLIITMAEFYFATGNRDFVLRHLAYITSMLKHFLRYVDADGAEQLPGFRFLDWLNSENLPAVHAGLQGLLCRMFISGKMLLECSSEDSSFLSEVIERMHRHVPDCCGSKIAAAMLTLSGIADRRDIIADQPFNGIGTFGGFYILSVKNTSSALELIRRYWGAMLDRGATTFWEDFDLSWLENSGRIDELPRCGEKDLHADSGRYCYQGIRHSLCHGWASGPLAFLSERLSGIRFLVPGGKRVAIEPELGDLEYMRCVYPTCLGDIDVKLERGRKPQIALPDTIELEEGK